MRCVIFSFALLMLKLALGQNLVNKIPVFPDNIIAFPNRDFVTLEGYQGRVGQKFMLQALRKGKLIGNAIGIIKAGDVAEEINHPGGLCWGAGTNVKVTPDLVAGDQLRLIFPNSNNLVAAITTILDAAVTKVVASGRQIVATGRISPSMNRQFFECRVVAPDLRNTVVARRDARAEPGPIVPSDKGGYSSGVSFTRNTFTCVFNFDTAAVVPIALAGEWRALTWQRADAAANRQGLTIAEKDLTGGPGFGGCPLGPQDLPAPVPGTATFTRSADKKSFLIRWAPAQVIFGTAPVTGYQVTATAWRPNADGVFPTITQRIAPTATATTLRGLLVNRKYVVEVRSLTGTDLSAPRFATPVAAAA